MNLYSPVGELPFVGPAYKKTRETGNKNSQRFVASYSS